MRLPDALTKVKVCPYLRRENISFPKGTTEKSHLEEMMTHLEEVAPGIGKGARVDVNQIKIFEAHLPDLIIEESLTFEQRLFTGGFLPAKMAGLVR